MSEKSFLPPDKHCYFLMAFGFTWLYEVPIFGLLHLPHFPWIIPATFLGPTVSAFIMTWVFNNARGSLLLAMLIHASFNTTYGVVLPKLFPSLPAAPLANLNIALIGMALLVIVATRGRLSYQRYQRETALPAPGTDRLVALRDQQ
jgi:hypothetical protein